MTVAVVVPVPKWMPPFVRQPLVARSRNRKQRLFHLTAGRVATARLSDTTIVATDATSLLRRERFRMAAIVETASHRTLFEYALDAVERRCPKSRTVVIVSPLQPRFRRWHLQAMLTDHLVRSRKCSVMVCPQRREGRLDTKVVKVAIGHHARALWFSRGLTYCQPTRGVDWCYWHCGVDILEIDALRRVVSHPPSPIEIAERVDHLRLIDAEIPSHCYLAPRTYPLIHSKEQLESAGPELGWHNQYL